MTPSCDSPPVETTEWGDLDTLVELLDKATEPEWVAMCMGSEGYFIVEKIGSTGRRSMRIAACTHEAWAVDRNNAELIVALRNAAPALLSELAEARRKIAAVERVAQGFERSDRGDYAEIIRAALDPS